MAHRTPDQKSYDDVTAKIARVEARRVKFAGVVMALIASVFVGSGQSKFSLCLIAGSVAVLLSLAASAGEKLEKLRSKQGELFSAVLVAAENGPTRGSSAKIAEPGK